MAEQGGWQLSGSGPEAYERYTIVAFMGAWAQELVEVGGVRAGQRVLDVGCGTGIVARKAARFAGTTGLVVGLDVNEGMLQMAKRFAAEEELDSIEWQHGDAASMPLADKAYDLVLCQQGLQYFPDRAATMREMARVLAPGGRLALSVWRGLERHPYFSALARALEGSLGSGAAASLRTAFALTDREELRALAVGAGFRNVKVRLEVKMSRFASLEEFVPGYLVATPMASAVASMTERDRKLMIEGVIQSLRDYMDDDGMAAPMECHIVTAEK